MADSAPKASSVAALTRSAALIGQSHGFPSKLLFILLRLRLNDVRSELSLFVTWGTRPSASAARTPLVLSHRSYWVGLRDPIPLHDSGVSKTF
jgi:hypothetical protein